MSMHTYFIHICTMNTNFQQLRPEICGSGLDAKEIILVHCCTLFQDLQHCLFYSELNSFIYAQGELHTYATCCRTGNMTVTRT